MCSVLFPVEDWRQDQVARDLESRSTRPDTRQSKGAEDVWAGKTEGMLFAGRFTWVLHQTDGLVPQRGASQLSVALGPRDGSGDGAERKGGTGGRFQGRLDKHDSGGRGRGGRALSSQNKNSLAPEPGLLHSDTSSVS